MAELFLFIKRWQDKATDGFDSYGRKAAKNPFVFIGGTLFLVFLCGLGFLNFSVSQ
jgi:hypothetical protein